MAAPLRIGLTGGIGSGKSTAASVLAGFGAAVIDTDAIAREIAQPGGLAIPALREAFGDAAIDAAGGLDRPRMRTLAFGDPQVRQRLEAILHPLIGQETARRAAAATAPVQVFDVPLLAESGHWRQRVDRVLVIDCPEATQVARVVARSGWTEDAVRAVIAQQASRTHRRAVADAVVYNEGLDLAGLSDALLAVWNAWTQPARDRR